MKILHFFYFCLDYQMYQRPCELCGGVETLTDRQAKKLEVSAVPFKPNEDNMLLLFCEKDYVYYCAIFGWLSFALLSLESQI